MIEVWTDGACSNNGAKNAVGGWAYIIKQDGLLSSYSHGEQNTTNNRCEYLAMLNGLRSAEDRASPFEEIVCYSDSALLINTMNSWIFNWERNGWQRKTGPIKNLDLVKELHRYAVDPRFTFRKVAGHAGVEMNEQCDKLAVEAKKQLTEKIRNTHEGSNY